MVAEAADGLIQQAAEEAIREEKAAGGATTLGADKRHRASPLYSS